MEQAPAKNHSKIRLYVPQDFAAGMTLALPDGQSHYLLHVMRVKAGQPVAVFNGRDGLWQAELVQTGKKHASLALTQKLEAQRTSPDVWLAFAPIKTHTERMVEKAVELGVARLMPVITHHAVVRSVNTEKLMSHAVEAAEQCERHDVPLIEPYKDMASLLAAWPKDRMLLHADESGAGENLQTLLPQLAGQRYGICIGPEGGFSAEERKMIAAQPFAKGFGMGPRILRADTAAIAALACVQCFAGDWHAPPRFEREAS
jgi:16S rRNA (uracil1498-N3)-methyltransferase